MLFAFSSAATSFLAGGRVVAPRATVSHVSVSMAVASPEAEKTEVACAAHSSCDALLTPACAAQQLLMDLNEPIFPEVCEFAGVTLSRYLLEMARANPEHPDLNELEL